MNPQVEDHAGILEEARAMGASFADARYESRRTSIVEARDGEVVKVVSGEEEGVGLRVLVKGAWGFAATNRLARDGLRAVLEEAVGAARALSSRTKEPVELADAPAPRDVARWRPKVDATEVALEEARRVLRDVEEAARENPVVQSVRAQVESARAVTRVQNTEGLDVTVEAPRILLQMDLVAREGGEVIGYRSRIGGTRGWEIFQSEDPGAKARETAEGAARVLRAKPAPSGRMTVLVDPDLAGVFAHEAIGHACEADLVVAGESLLAGRLGEKLGSDLVTIVDDGTVPGAFGSLPYDSEGVKAARKVLVREGTLEGYILNRETAGKLGLVPNGGARAESYAVKPLVRMSNTLIEPGGWSFEEMLEGVERGVYCKGTRGGQVDVAKGSFQFGAQEAWLIENGEITTPLRDAALQGTILQTLNDIDAVGNRFELASPGICGKGQLVPVGDGGPTVRIRDAVIGGGA